MDIDGAEATALLAPREDEVVMKDLSDQELAELEIKCVEKADDKPIDAKKGKYAEKAGKPEKPKVYGVLYIHTGTKERAPIAEEEFKAFMNIADAKIMEAVWSD